MAYSNRYGMWAGNNSGVKPDYSKCCESVFSGHMPHQCSRKNGYGPDGNYCKQHDPAAVDKRNKKAAYNYAVERHRRYVAGLRDVLPLIQSIAAGCNDPRNLCQDWLDARADKLEPPVNPEDADEGHNNA